MEQNMRAIPMMQREAGVRPGMCGIMNMKIWTGGEMMPVEEETREEEMRKIVCPQRKE